MSNAANTLRPEALGDEAFIEYMASVELYTVMPAEWHDAPWKPIRRLVAMGVIPQPKDTDTLKDVTSRAIQACKDRVDAGKQR